MIICAVKCSSMFSTLRLLIAFSGYLYMLRTSVACDELRDFIVVLREGAELYELKHRLFTDIELHFKPLDEDGAMYTVRCTWQQSEKVGAN